MGVDRLADQSVCGLFSGWQRPSGSTATCGCIHALDAGPSPEPCHRRSATPRPSHRATVGLAARLSCTRARTSQSWCANRPAPVDQPERADRCVLGAYRARCNAGRSSGLGRYSPVGFCKMPPGCNARPLADCRVAITFSTASGIDPPIFTAQATSASASLSS